MLPDSADSAGSADLDLSRRLLTPRTIGSVVFGVALLFLLFRVVLDIDLAALGAALTRANPALLLVALAAYYATFPMRGARWAFILDQAGTRVRARDATEIVFLGWFVNCLVPAKLGDLYRAYLLKGNQGTAISSTVGTIFIERVADLVVMFWLALFTASLSLTDRARPEVDALLAAGFVFGGALMIVVIALRFLGARVERRLSGRLAEVFRLFRHGSTRPLSTRSLPVIGAVTAAIWIAEGARLYFVVQALGLPDLQIGPATAIFVALAGSLLTAIPLTPAGIGFVEAGIVGALTLYGAPPDQAAVVAIADRVITILSVVVLGGIAYAISGKVRRAHGLAAVDRPPNGIH